MSYQTLKIMLGDVQKDIKTKDVAARSYRKIELRSKIKSWITNEIQRTLVCDTKE